MKKHTLYDQLRQHLDDTVGNHQRIAKETGVSQATVSRIHLGLACPTLHTAQPLLDWFERNKGKVRKKKSTRGLSHARSRVLAAPADGDTTPALSE